MNEETKHPTTQDSETAEDKGRCAPASCSAFLESIFGKQSTKIEVSSEEPTMHLRWHKGVLQQLWEVTERHSHYSGDHYNHSTYHKRVKWRRVSGTPNDQADRLG